MVLERFFHDLYIQREFGILGNSVKLQHEEKEQPSHSRDHRKLVF